MKVEGCSTTFDVNRYVYSDRLQVEAYPIREEGHCNPLVPYSNIPARSQVIFLLFFNFERNAWPNLHPFLIWQESSLLPFSIKKTLCPRFQSKKKTSCSQPHFQLKRKTFHLRRLVNLTDLLIYVTVNVDNWSFYRITGHSI